MRQTSRGFLICFCVLICVFAIIAAFGIPRIPENRLHDLKTAAASGFVFEETDGKGIMRHANLGIAVQVPDDHFFPVPVRMKTADGFGWGFYNKSRRMGYIVIAFHKPLSTSADAEKALHVAMQSMHRTYFMEKEGVQLELIVEHEDAAWQASPRYAEAIGAVGKMAFCSRLIQAEGRRGNQPTYAIAAFAPDQSDACNLARSLSVTSPE